MHRPALLCKSGNGHSSISQLKQNISSPSANYEAGSRRFIKVEQIGQILRIQSIEQLLVLTFFHPHRGITCRTFKLRPTLLIGSDGMIERIG